MCMLDSAGMYALLYNFGVIEWYASKATTRYFLILVLELFLPHASFSRCIRDMLSLGISNFVGIPRKPLNPNKGSRFVGCVRGIPKP